MQECIQVCMNGSGNKATEGRNVESLASCWSFRASLDPNMSFLRIESESVSHSAVSNSL